LSYATRRICSCMCRMQLKTSCIRQLQNGKFLVVCAPRVKPSRKMRFNEFDLSLSEKVCIYHYYVPMFLWCKWELKLHTLKYKKGKYVRPLVVCDQYWTRQWWWCTIYLCFLVEHWSSLASVFMCLSSLCFTTYGFCKCIICNDN
jgi:hypothetical protein